jgi:hypothetical protein
MAVANTLAYFDAATIRAVKSFIGLALGVILAKRLTIINGASYQLNFWGSLIPSPSIVRRLAS